MLALATEAVLPDIRAALARAQNEATALSRRLDEERAGAFSKGLGGQLSSRLPLAASLACLPDGRRSGPMRLHEH